MAWLFVPGLAGLNSGCELHSGSVTAASVTSRGKPLPPQRLSASWKRNAWMRRLSGMTCEPSTLARGVERWISSLRDTPASPSPSPGSSEAPPTSGTSGQRSLASSRNAARGLFSVRTSLDTSAGACQKFPLICDGLGTSCLDRSCLKPQPSERPTSANDSSSSRGGRRPETGHSSQSPPCSVNSQAGFGESWPTPDANVFQDGMECTPEEWEARRQRLKENCPTPNGNGCGTPLAMASQLWQTPRVESATKHRTEEQVNAEIANHSRGGTSTGRLEDQIALWGTPTSRDHKDGACAEADVPTASLLGREAVQWERPDVPEQTTNTWMSPSAGDAKGRTYTYDQHNKDKPRAALEMQSSRTSRPVLSALDGRPLSPTTRTLRRRLNPAFVCWLMGWPIWWTNPAWTNSGRQAMESYLSRQRWLLSSLCAGLES
jgi:hypothetical protein